MEGRTHFTAGLLLWALGFGPEALLGSLFPDVDCEKAVLGLPVVARTYGHRGIFHSLSFLAIIGGGADIAGLGGFAVGYAGHLALDSLTVSGTTLFAPFSGRKLRGPLVTGDFFDLLLSGVFAALALVFAIY